MTIYIDIIFLENLVLNFIILYATGLISKSKFRLWEILLRCYIRSLLCSNLLLYKSAKSFWFDIKIYLINYYDIYIFQAKEYKRNF